MPLEINQSLRPPGGYFFIDADKVRHEGSSANNLASNLAKYRASMGRPIGNALLEVTEQICKRAPTHCVGESDGTEAAYDAKQFATIVAAGIRRDTLEHSRRPMQMVSKEIADARLAICAGCPGRVDWTIGCAPCQKSVAGFTEQIVSPNTPTEGSDRLACLGDAQSLGVEVWRAVTHKLTHPDAPGNCWRRAEVTQ